MLCISQSKIAKLVAYYGYDVSNFLSDFVFSQITGYINEIIFGAQRDIHITRYDCVNNAARKDSHTRTRGNGRQSGNESVCAEADTGGEACVLAHADYGFVEKRKEFFRQLNKLVVFQFIKVERFFQKAGAKPE